MMIKHERESILLYTPNAEEQRQSLGETEGPTIRTHSSTAGISEHGDHSATRIRGI
jgi:hypothetical protein